MHKSHFSDLYNYNILKILIMIRRILYQFSANPYKILGVAQTATANEIKLAYYQLAQQYHPDKNSSKDAAKHFTQISQAYEILSDESKRKIFDSCGVRTEDPDEDFDQEFEQSMRGNRKSTGKKKKSQYYSKFYSEDYDSIFSEFDKFFQQKHGKRKAYHAKKKGEDVKMAIKLKFKEALFGTQKSISYQRQKTCDSCSGSRAAPNSAPQKCYTCGGSGWLTYVDHGSSMDVKCKNCDGWGKVVRDPCKKCKGEGVTEVTQDRQIDIPRGVNVGTVIRLGGAGNASKTGGEAGDLMIEVEIEEDTNMRRDGHNIVSDMQLSISEMVLGCNKEVDTIWGKLKINIPGCQQPSTKLQIPQYGIQYGQSNWKKGDHILVLRLCIPKDLSQGQKELFAELERAK